MIRRRPSRNSYLAAPLAPVTWQAAWRDSDVRVRQCERERAQPYTRTHTRRQSVATFVGKLVGPAYSFLSQWACTRPHLSTSMFSKRNLSSLLSPTKRSGSYRVKQVADADDNGDQWRCEIDQNNNSNITDTGTDNNTVDDDNNYNYCHYSYCNVANDEHVQSIISSAADFNQNNARPLRRLRSISFSRLIYLKQASCSYELSPKRRKRPARPLTSHHHHSNCQRLNSNHHHQDGVTLCTLGVGTTFGASVTPGKSHSVSVVTNEECTLLRVRRADFQEIFNEQSHLIGDVESSPFCSFTSLNKAISLAAGGDSGALIRPSAARRLFGAPGASSAHHRHHRPAPGQTQPAGQARRSSLAPASGASHECGAERRQSVVAGGGSTNGRPAAGPNRQQAREHVAALRLQPARGACPERAHADACGQPPAQADQGQGADAHPDSADQEPGAAGQQQEGEAELEEELNNLDSLDANELSSQLMRVGWVLRTLVLAHCPRLVQNRRVYPHQKTQAPVAPSAGQPQLAAKKGAPGTPIKQARHLVSAGSSSQLLGSPPQSTKSAASAAGRKVANYVASSFMRTAAGAKPGSAGAAAQKQATNPLVQPFNKLASSLNQFSSNSFDANHGQSGAGAQPNELGDGRSQARASLASRLAGADDLAASQVCQEPVLLRNCMSGREMVDWLLQLSQTNTSSARFVTSRLQAVSMWQVLLEQGVVLAPSTEPAACQELGQPDAPPAASLAHLSCLPADVCGSAGPARQQQFCDDRAAYYKFWFDREHELELERELDLQHQEAGEPGAEPARPSEPDVELARDALWWSLKLLTKLAPDACFRFILAKQPHQRTAEEVDIVFEELQHLKALSHLTNSVKKELAACVQSEHHARQNTVIFNQGDVGHSWYIILRGSVNVIIVGKGVVCTLHDGDDFGKLALVNDAPRAATIVTNEPNCYFLRVDKQNFNTILRDVEANTVRLKEHGGYRGRRPKLISARAPG